MTSIFVTAVRPSRTTLPTFMGVAGLVASTTRKTKQHYNCLQNQLFFQKKIILLQLLLKQSGLISTINITNVTNDAFEIEAKVMPLPAKLEGALKTVKSRGSKDKLQMVVMKPKGASWDDARVFLSFNSFMEWFGD